ncbi:MAG: hypothetical protein KME46_25885 [Brasilonema angustatum HA4187-MV1]|jgi:hypothetical protein|nr:hypothetical protein [Brasilonema angustatum HA4187-MV1]
MPRSTSTTKTTAKKTRATKAKAPAKPKTQAAGVSFAQLQRDALQLGYKVTKSVKGITASKDGLKPEKVLFAGIKDFETWLDGKIANGAQESELLKQEEGEESEATKAKVPAKPKTQSTGVSFAQLQRDALQLGYKITRSAKGITASKDGLESEKILFAGVKDFETWLDSKIANEAQESKLLRQEEDEETEDLQQDESGEDTEEDIPSSKNVNLIDRKTESFFYSCIPLNSEAKQRIQDLHDLCDYDSLDAWTKVQVCKAFQLPSNINDLDMAEIIARLGLSLKVYEHPDLVLAYDVYDPQAAKP